jgi:hypothetical protein
MKYWPKVMVSGLAAKCAESPGKLKKKNTSVAPNPGLSSDPSDILQVILLHR